MVNRRSFFGGILASLGFLLPKPAEAGPKLRGAFTKRDVALDPYCWEGALSYMQDPTKARLVRIPDGIWSALVTWDCMREWALARPGEVQSLLSVDPLTREHQGHFEIRWVPNGR